MAESSNTVTTQWLLDRSNVQTGLRDMVMQAQATFDQISSMKIEIGIEGYDGLTPVAEQAVADAQAMEATIPIVGEDDLTAAVDAAIEANSGKSVTVNIKGADDTGGGGAGGGGFGGRGIGRMAGMMMLYAGIREIDEKMKADSEEAARLAGNHQDAVKNAQKELEAFDKLHTGVLSADIKDAGNYKYSMMDQAPGANYNPHDPDRPSAVDRQALVDALDHAKEVEEEAKINARKMKEADRERAKVEHEQSLANIDAMPAGAGRDRAIAEEGLKLAKEQAKLMDDTGKAGAARAVEFMASAQKVYDDQVAKADALDKKDEKNWDNKMERDAEAWAADAKKWANEDARAEKEKQRENDKRSAGAFKLDDEKQKQEEAEDKEEARESNRVADLNERTKEVSLEAHGQSKMAQLSRLEYEIEKQYVNAKTPEERAAVQRLGSAQLDALTPRHVEFKDPMAAWKDMQQGDGGLGNFGPAVKEFRDLLKDGQKLLDTAARMGIVGIF